MRTVRLAACAATVAAISLAPAATAAVSCNLVVDPKGDARVGDAPPGYYVSPDQDLLGADIASSKRHLTAAIRLVSLGPAVNPDAPTGRVYNVAFNVGKHRFSMTATYGPDGYQGSAWDEDNGIGIGDASVVIDQSARQVRLTAPAGLFGVSNGRIVSGITVTAGHRYGTNSSKAVPTPVGYGAWVGGLGLNSTVDTASGTKAYVAGSKSCVTPAR